MKREELDAMRKRAEATTEGNWRVTLDDPYNRNYVLGAFNGVVTVIADIKGDANAEFIANARQDVPALLAEVERLQAESTYWRMEHEHQRKQADMYREKFIRSNDGIAEETRKLRQEIERHRREKNFDWDIGY